MSVEHIVPESLGGGWVLPAGTICDRCNNYFARKIEEPLLSNGRFRNLRMRQLIPSKKGTIPPSDAILLASRPIRVEFVAIGSELRVQSRSAKERLEVEDFLGSCSSGRIIFAPGAFVDDKILQRFVAKLAIECLALNALEAKVPVAELAGRSELDDLRKFARNGDNFEQWPISIRRKYDENKLTELNGELVQVISEYEFFYTDGNLLYFAVCIFGVELCIAMGGPENFDREKLLSVPLKK